MIDQMCYNEGNINDKGVQACLAPVRLLSTEREKLSMDSLNHTTSPLPCYLYVIVCGDACKIGITADPANRISYLQTANPQPLTVACLLQCEDQDAALQLELLLHRRYANHHIRGEWFSVSADTVVADMNFALAVAGMNHVPVFMTGDMPKPTSLTNPAAPRVPSATNIAKQWLKDNPDKAHLPLRELESMIGVGKDSIAKARKEFAQ